MVTNAIDPIFFKIEAIACGDCKLSFKALEEVFEQRKKCAKLMLLENDSSNARAFIELCNEKIKEALYL